MWAAKPTIREKTSKKATSDSGANDSVKKEDLGLSVFCCLLARYVREPDESWAPSNLRGDDRKKTDIWSRG